MQEEKRKFHIYNNGLIARRVYEGDPIPDGFVRGNLNKGRPAWNKGLSANTDERVKRIGQQTKETRIKNNSYSSWRKGLTKETDERLKLIGEKCSKTRKQKYADGELTTWNKGLKASEDERVRLNHQHTTEARKKNGSFIAWNKGLTKEDNEALQIVSEKVSKTRKEKHIEPWNKGKTMTTEHRKHLSETRLEKFANGELTTWNKGLTKYDHPSLMATSIKATGRPCMVNDWEAAKRKEHETKTRNHSWQYSKPEEDYYKMLCSQYGADDIVRQYVSELYPYRCDFYIKSKDLYIELNYSFDHESHPFDPNNKEDLAKVDYYKSKINKARSRYANIIYVWTIRDPEKLKTMRDNKLNFKVVYKDNLVIEK